MKRNGREFTLKLTMRKPDVRKCRLFVCLLLLLLFKKNTIKSACIANMWVHVKRNNNNKHWSLCKCACCHYFFILKVEKKIITMDLDTKWINGIAVVNCINCHLIGVTISRKNLWDCCFLFRFSHLKHFT